MKWHGPNPFSVDYNDEASLPSVSEPCSADRYPQYVIVAESAQDVQAGVNFARGTGMRLVIKGTGHDFPGRSSGPDSLSIYTHHMQGLSVNRSDPRATALGAYGSIKIFAGEQLGRIERFAAANNVTAITGSDANVGIGGWVSGGGHGPLTAKYGMGADQVLEMEVVTADGEFRTINADENADLFWAMRGGGPGNFAVLISVTMKTYPRIDAYELYYSYNTTADSDTFWSLAAYSDSQLPSLAEQGVYGYYYVTPGSNATANGSVSAAWIGPGLDAEQMKAILAPMNAYINTTDTWDDTVSIYETTVQSGNHVILVESDS